MEQTKAITVEDIVELGFIERNRQPYETVYRYSVDGNRFFVIRKSHHNDKFYFDSHYGGLRIEIKSIRHLKEIFHALVGRSI